MTLTEVLLILQNRMIALDQARKAAVSSGDLANIIKIDEDILTTQSSIQRIQTMLANGIQ